MSTLELRSLRKQFDQTAVIHGIDLKVEHGEFVVFVGPSGCGKSTLLRMIAGLDLPTDGEVRIDDQRVNEVGAADRGCAMVFQSYALYPHMSVYDNMAFGLENANVPRSEIEKKVQEAANLLRLDPLLQRRPTQLSGGQRQRVAIGRAIVRNPKIFLFDEPLSNLMPFKNVYPRGVPRARCRMRRSTAASSASTVAEESPKESSPILSAPAVCSTVEAALHERTDWGIGVAAAASGRTRREVLSTPSPV